MIVQSRLIFAAVLVISSALHLAAMTMIGARPSVKMEGGAPAAESSLGSSFADLAQGVQHPVKTVSEISEPVKPVTKVSEPVTQTVHRPVAVKADSPPPTAKSAAPAETTAVSATSSVTKATSPTVVAAAPQQTQTDARPISPDSVVAALPEAVAPKVSLRPKQRNERLNPPKAKPAPKPAKPRGNANRNAKAGTQDGNAAKASQPRHASKKRTQMAQGNAAASNYPGEVMRRLSRVPRPRSAARGVAVIAFTIAANGNLASVGVAGSSGSSALDRAALAVVRKAQPFPPPPAGARRSFSIKIKGR